MHVQPFNLASLLGAFCVYEIEWLAARYGVRRQELQKIRDLVRGPVPVRRGEVLYREGSAGQSIYAIASGSFKASATDAHGRETVTDLYFDGDFFGLEALGGDTYQGTLEALESGSVFRLSVPALREALSDVPGLEKELMSLMSREVWRQEERRLLIGQRDAGSRLASFLLYLSSREESRGRDPDSFRLQMRRQDIAAFLGLATETVSRLLKRFAQLRLIEVNSRRVRLRNPEAISRMVGRKYLPAVALMFSFSSLFF